MDEETPPSGPPKLRIIQNKRGAGLTAEQYEILAQTYLTLKRRSSRALAEATGVTKQTALKAISVGWPHRGWAPLSERAKLYDARRAQEEDKRSLPLTPTQVIDVQRFISMRETNLNAAAATRALAGRLMNQVMEASQTATANRQGKRTRVIDVVKRGKVVGQRVVQEDVTLPPYLPHLAQAANDLGRLLFAAGESEKEWARVVPPEGAPDADAGWDRLTDKQLSEVVATGKLPEGVTHEMIYGGRPRPK